MARSQNTHRGLQSDVAPKPEVAAEKPGYMKVRLQYLTSNPNHIRSLFLAHAYEIPPPYHEEVCVLMPRMKVFTRLEAFLPIFEYLQDAAIIEKSAELLNFRVLDEDNLTLAYIL